jgi:O-antigen/teichoic acid export membrane protein
MRLAARNLGSNYLAYAASVVSGLVLTPIIIDAIGQEGYGAWVFIVSLTTVLRLLDFGITPTVVRFTAFHRGREEAQEIDALASASLAVFLLFGLLSLLAGLVLAWFLPDMISLSPELQQPAQVATVIAVLTLGTQAPLGLFGSLLKGAQRFDVLNAGALVSIVAYALLVIVVLTRHSTLPVLATIALVATIIRLGYPVFFIRRELPGLRLSRASVSRANVRGLLGFSWFAFLGHVSGKIVYAADVIVIGAVLGARQVALYGVAARLFGLAAGVASTGTDLLLPLQSELEGKGEHDRQRLFVTTGIRASTCVAVLLGLPLVILPSWILTAWLGSDFAASVAPLALLGAAVAFTQPSNVLSQYLFARGRPALLALAQSSLAVTNLGLTTILLLTVGDIWVAALATLAVEGVGAIVVLPLLARRRGVSLRRLAAAWSQPVAVGILAAVPTLLLARAVTETNSLIALAFVGAAWTVVFGALAWRLALTDIERLLVRRLVAGRRGGPSKPSTSL